jgi:MFS family permease
MRQFNRLFTASVLSNLGDGVMITAFPLLATGFTSSPPAVAAMTAAATAPWLLFGLVSGVFVDRVERIRMMWIVDLARAAVVGGLWLLLAGGGGGLPLLYAVVFVLGVAETLFDSAAMAVVPSLVESRSLEKANGRLFAGQLVTNQFVGPPLGALLFGLAATLPVAVDSISFLVSALLLLRIRVPRHEPPVASRRSVLTELKEGLGWLWSHRDIRAMAIGAAVINLAYTGALAVLVLFAKEDLGLSDLGYGALFVAMGTGALIGSLTASRVSGRMGRRTTMILSVALISVGLLVIGLIPVVVVTAVGMSAISLVTEFWNVVAVSYRQHATPDHLRGRVMSAYRFIAYGSYPLGALWGGWVAGVAGIPMTFLLGGMAVAGLAVYLSRSLGPLD